MRVLVVGSGGREHALVWAISKSSAVSHLMCAPGNPGMSRFAERHSVSIDDLEGLVELCKFERVELAVIGPEAPLVAGVADALRSEGVTVFGPGAAGARLEGSKSFAKALMSRAGIPTAGAREFSDTGAALSYIDEVGPPLVIKADGLAAGKGVTVCEDADSAQSAVIEALSDRKFGEAGSTILIEEMLVGKELSVLAFSDGKRVLALEPARDYKRVFDGDRGPNTGGMGSYSPVPDADLALQDAVRREILEPIANALNSEVEPYVGVLYAGLMLTSQGPKVIEFNCRFGDPETQSLLPRLETDLLEIIIACTEGRLDEIALRWKRDSCVTVVVSSQGYPADFPTGFPIEGLDDAEAFTGIPVFHAGTKLGADGAVVTSGGRVLSVSALGSDVGEARATAYEAVAAIRFPGMHSRSDIGARNSLPI